MLGNAFWVVGDPTSSMTRLVFVEVAEPKTVENRVHVDLLPTDEGSGSEVDRILGLAPRSWTTAGQ